MSNVNETNTSIYTEDELADLKRAKQVRLKIVDSMTNDGKSVPDRVGDIRVLNEVITGLEKSAHDSANNRLKFQDTQNQEAVAENVAELLKQISNKPSTVNNVTNVMLDDKYIPVDIVPGETDISPEQLEINKYTDDEEERE